MLSLYIHKIVKAYFSCCLNLFTDKRTDIEHSLHKLRIDLNLAIGPFPQNAPYAVHCRVIKEYKYATSTPKPANKNNLKIALRLLGKGPYLYATGLKKDNFLLV